MSFIIVCLHAESLSIDILMPFVSAKNGDAMKVLDIVFTDQMTLINATYSLSKLY